MPHYAIQKKQIFDTNSTEVGLIPGCKQPNRWIRVYDMHMQYILILICNLSAKCVYAFKIATTLHYNVVKNVFSKATKTYFNPLSTL